MLDRESGRGRKSNRGVGEVATNAEILEILHRVERKFDEHCVRHEEWDRRLTDHERVLFGSREGTNGERMGLVQKMTIIWNTKNSATDVFWKVVSGVTLAVALIILGIR